MKSNKKLMLKKNTVANLNNVQMGEVKGGTGGNNSIDDPFCLTYLVCSYIMKCPVPPPDPPTEN